MNQLEVKQYGDQYYLRRTHADALGRRNIGLFDSLEEALDRAEDILCGSFASACSVQSDPEPALTPRNCIACQAPFQSEGPHHRMCARCRQRTLPGDWM